jgi:aldehyde:ferredoxin oxidoreductase
VHGYHGCYLRTDLGSGRCERVEIPERVLRRYLGGVGLAAWLLHREHPRGVGALDPRAALVFAFSPLVGTSVTTSAKFAVAAKSPLTGMFCDAMASSHFAIAAKRLGVDALVFVGAAPEPSVWVGGRLEATSLWGASAAEAGRALRSRGRAVAIGVAGENRVRFATLSSEGRHAGRGGLGAVMGAKRLKAVVAQGEVATTVAQPDRLEEISRDLRARSLGPGTVKYRELGTAANVAAFDRLGLLPTRNFRAGTFAGAEALSAESLRASRPRERTSCAACSIGCEHRYGLTSGESVRVEYESLFALGSLCDVGDPEVTLSAIARCDERGVDTISTGATLSFAMECAERGWLTGGPDPRDGAAWLGLIDEIAARRGFGARLADGSRALAETLGAEAEAIAPHVKGLELPGYEPRALPHMALGFAVGSRGADHNRSSAYEVDFAAGPPGGVTAVIAAEDRAALLDSLILCKFLRGAFEDLDAEAAALLTAVTGFDIDAAELASAAKRIVASRKAWNVREGWSPRDDTLPERFFRDALSAETPPLSRERLSRTICDYNLSRGWRRDGHLPADVLKDLASDDQLGADR